MTTNTAGLSFTQAMEDAELTLSDDSGETDISPVSEEPVVQLEQPAVETETETGLFDSLVEQAEQPQGDSGELYDVNGEMVSLDQLRAGYMMQADYTQKTQRAAEREREAESALDLMRLLEERPVETVRKLYQQINQGAPITGTDAAIVTPSLSDQTNAPDIEKLVEARVAEMLANDPRLVRVQQDQALDQVNGIFAEIEDMYNVKLTNLDKETTLRKAQEMDTTDLKFVFGGLMNQVNQKRDELRNAKSVKPVAPEYAPPTDQAPVVPKKFQDFRSAVNEALAAEQALDG